MGNFWATSDGQKATGEVKENSFDDTPLAKGDYNSIIETAEVNEWQGERTVNFKTRALDLNRVLFPKLRVFDKDEKKRDRAIQLLVKCANSVGVKLPEGEPDDIWLSKLCDKPLTIKYDVYKFTPAGETEEKTGNFIINFEAKGHKAGGQTSKPATTRKAPDIDPDSDVPF